SETTEMRKWTSNDGRTMQAQLINADSLEALQFKLKSGQKAQIPITRLSEADATFIVMWQQSQEALSEPTEADVKQSNENDAVEHAKEKLPRKFTLKRMPMVVQFGNYCVPASAAMIANFHDLDVDQYQIAQLSSAGSAGNLGTFPRDMKLAMEKIGFTGKEEFWNNSNEFQQDILPQIKNALFREGPIYISFRPGVFGSMGHGCVIVGYDDRKAELHFHNPWGNTFEKTYAAVAVQSAGLVYIQAPKKSPVATDEKIIALQQKMPRTTGNLRDLYNTLKFQSISFDLIWCNRYDTLEDRSFADDTARRDGRLMLKLAFRRNPAVILPNSPKGETKSFYLVSRPPNGGAQYKVQEITPQGWGPAKLMTLGSLTREWPTLVENKSGERVLWQLPLIELAL
ncbi:MAG: C39 family peptidase, partial [Puniceicoccaceae bacterium]|nr:C39 family peptidase [Puniceicoccaceae bacterium]